MCGRYALYAAWLNPHLTDAAAIKKLLLPFPDSLLEFHPVSRDVNNSRNDSARLIKPV